MRHYNRLLFLAIQTALYYKPQLVINLCSIYNNKSKRNTMTVLFFVAKKHEILTALHYKSLYNISCIEKRGRKYTSRGL